MSAKKPKTIDPAAGTDEALKPMKDYVESMKIPPCPPSDPSLSIKTPAVVEWWFQYHPEEAAVKYAGLTLP
jgi:hypothetical protein